jgi:signal transduction histidine kinase
VLAMQEGLAPHDPAVRRALSRMADLNNITHALFGATTVAEVARVVTEQAYDALDASGAVIYSAVEGSTLIFEASRGAAVAPEKERMLSLEARAPVAETVRESRPLWLSSREEIITRYPSIGERFAKDKLQSMAALPLITPSSVIGAIAFSFDDVREFEGLEQHALLVVAAQCAQALERAKLLENERAARAQAERAKEQLEILNRVATRMMEAEPHHTNLVEVFIEGGKAITGATFASFLPSFDTGARPFPEPVESYLSVPIVSRGGKLHGGLYFGHRERSMFTAEHEHLAAAIAAQAALALDNATLIEEARKAEEHHARRAEELKQTLHFNELFAAILAHDLRSPLTAVLIGAQAVAIKTKDDVSLRTLARVQSSARRMGRMVDQLLDLTRSRVGGGFKLDLLQIDVAQVARQVIAEVADGSSESRLLFEVSGDTNGTYDADRLAQIVSNVVGNAVNHGKNGEVRVAIDGTQPDEIVVEVHNEGVIPPAILENLFDPFRGKGQRRSTSAGLGLGLYISKQLALAHKGDIEVHSSEDLGTTVIVRLPRAAAI